MDHDTADDLPASLEPADAPGQAELEAYQIQAAEKLRAVMEAHRQQIAVLSATQIDLEALTASSWAELPIAYDDLARALLLTDLATVERKGWRQSVKKAEARLPGSSLDAYQILTEVLEEQGSDGAGAGSTSKPKADRIATILEVRGDVLRVTAGDEALRCSVDVPLRLSTSSVSYRSAPFRVVSLNLYKFIVAVGREATLNKLGTGINLCYNPVEGTLSVPFREGPVLLATQRLSRRLADPEAGDIKLPGTPFDPSVLAHALAYAGISVPVAGQGGSSPFAEVLNGRAVGYCPTSVSIYTHAALNGLELFIERAQLASVVDMLRKFGGAAEVRTTPSHYVFSDGGLTLRVARVERTAISGITPMLARTRKQPGPEVSVPYELLADGLARSMFRSLFRRNDRLTQIKLGRLAIDNPLPAHTEPNVVEFLAAMAIAEIKMATLDPDNEWSELVEGPQASTDRPDLKQRPTASALDQDHASAVSMGSAEASANTIGSMDASDHATPSALSGDLSQVGWSELEKAAFSDGSDHPLESLEPSQTETPQEQHRPMQLVLKFLTPNSAPSAGWTPFWVPVTDVTGLDDEPDWLMAGQLFDIRQFARAVQFDRTSKPRCLRLIERALLLESTEQGGDAVTILASETGAEFGSTKLLLSDW